MSRSARFPWLDGRPTHLPCGPGDVPAHVLLPGDPDRVPLAASLLDDVRDLGQRREFAAAAGSWRGVPVGLCSTGIGGPSTEIAAVELVNIGATTLIRIGGMGAIDPTLALGSFVIVERAAGDTGAARLYGASPDGVMADRSVVGALVRAAQLLGLPHRRGAIHTTDSYYLGQGRPTTRDGDAACPTIVADAARAGFVGLDMECETLFACARHLGVRAGAVLAVHGNRATDRWLEDYVETQRDLVRLAATAVTLLAPSKEELSR